MSEEEIPMYCCLVFSCAVHYGFISIDTESIQCLVRLQSSKSASEKAEIQTKLMKEYRVLDMNADYFHLIYCPFCGTYLPSIIDYAKGNHAGQYSSKEGWEK